MKPLLNWMMTPRGLKFDRWLVKHTGTSLLTRLFARHGGFKPGPTLVLVTKGRRTGEPREVALPWFEPEGVDCNEGFLLVGSKGGAPSDPYWIHNIRAHADVDIIVNRRRRKGRARLLDGDEYKRVWERLMNEIPTYRQYQDRASGHRNIPVVLVEPLS